MSYTIEEFDNTKTKMLKYIMYKKRTEKEVRQKFSSSVDEILLDEVIENLKELGYINDSKYVERAINEFVAINTLSIKEIEYKLFSKGVSNDIIEQYIDKNIETLKEYEQKCAQKLYYKKQANMEKEDIINFLRKKGYTSETIRNLED
jgi:SOS response regulatory protein OraA/RecX